MKSAAASVVTGAVILAGLLPAAASAHPGDPLASFGTAGLATLHAGDARGDNSGESIAAGPNGTLYVAGSAVGPNGGYELFVSQFLANGTLDTAFGSGGTVVENVGDQSADDGPETAELTDPQSAASIAVNGAGNIIVATNYTESTGHLGTAVLEFLPSGRLNPGFNGSGVVLEPLEPGSGGQIDSEPFGLAVDASGRIVIAGACGLGTGFGSSDVVSCLSRLNTNGSVDTSFATQGLYTETFSPYEGDSTAAEALVVEPDSSIVFGGYAQLHSGDTVMYLDKVNASGAEVGNGFPAMVQAGNNGSGTGSPVSIGYQIASTPDGGLIEAGTAADDQNDDEEIAVRFDAEGDIDTAWGDAGVFTSQLGSIPAPDGGGSITAGSSTATGLAVSANGTALLSGTATVEGDASEETVERLTASGQLDPSFGTSGVAEYPLSASGGTTAYRAVLTSDGALAITGDLANSAGSSDTFVNEVDVDNAPAVSTTIPATATVGQPVAMTASVTADTGRIISSVVWDLGSGSFTDASGPSITHTFATAGIYTVRVQATDSEGVSTVQSQMITVAAPASPASGTGTPAVPAAGTGAQPVTPAAAPVTPAQPVAPVVIAPAAPLVLAQAKVQGAKVTLQLTCKTGICSAATTLTTVERFSGNRLLGFSAQKPSVTAQRAHAIKAKLRLVTVTIGSTRTTVKAGKKQLVTITLNAAGRKLLKAHRTLPVLLTVTSLAKTKAKPKALTRVLKLT